MSRRHKIALAAGTAAGVLSLWSYLITGSAIVTAIGAAVGAWLGAELGENATFGDDDEE